MGKKSNPKSGPTDLKFVASLALLVTGLALALAIAQALQPRQEITNIAPTIHGPVTAPVTIQISADRPTAVDAEARIER